MDQNSSNDTEKRNWRERLGIGTKEMPKIAGEFSKPAEPVLVIPAARGEGRGDSAQPVVVAKPAPMAPRVSAKAAPPRAVPASERAARAPQPAPATATRPMQPSPPQSPDVLAERLRNQREAAEKLAEQRVNNAKERAEAHKAAQQPPQSSAQPSSLPPPGQRPRPERGKPKFSFAEDDMRADAKREPRPMPPLRQGGPAAQQARPPAPQPQPMQPQIAPARPPLGGAGERFVNPQVPPPSRPMAPPAAAGPGFPPQYRPQPPGPGYRPIDPASGYVPPPSFQMPRGTMAPPPGPRPAPMPAGMAGDPRLQSGPYISDPYSPQPMPAGGIPRYDQIPRGAPPPLRSEHLRPQTHSYDGDMQDEIFEDSPKPVRRASPSDYSQAYHPDADLDYAPPRRRSGGPLMLLMLLGVAAAVGIGGVLYYQNMLKSGSGTTTDATPVVPAPGDPVKTPVENSGAGQSNTTSAQPSRKQIYDRIVGDKEVLGGQVVPTEEAPVQPALDQTTQPAALPQPAAGSAEEPLPLPMPPPVNNTQGNAGGEALPAPVPQSATAEPIPAPVPGSDNTTVTATGYSSEQQQQMAAASQQQTVIEDQLPQAAPPQEAAAEPPSEMAAEPPQDAKPAAKAKSAAKPKPKKKVETAAARDLGAEPVVLVPQQNGADGAAITQDPAVTIDGEPALQGAAPVEQPVKKKKTLLGLFTGENKRAGQEGQAGGIDAATEQQVASVNTRQATVEAAPPAAAATGARTGFTLQLASFATEGEAKAEYQRVAARHSGTVNGLSPIIAPVSVGGSTRYRLSLGTVSSSTQAQTLCKELAAAGLRDCVVRRR